MFHPRVLVCTQVKADRSSTRLTTLQQASRHVNQMAANVVASTRTGQEHLEEKGESNLTWPQDLCRLWQAPNNPVLSCTDTMDFSGMSLIKLRKEEMESQVRFLRSLLAETWQTWSDATSSTSSRRLLWCQCSVYGPLILQIGSYNIDFRKNVCAFRMSFIISFSAYLKKLKAANWN